MELITCPGCKVEFEETEANHIPKTKEAWWFRLRFGPFTIVCPNCNAVLENKLPKDIKLSAVVICPLLILNIIFHYWLNDESWSFVFGIIKFLTLASFVLVIVSCRDNRYELEVKGYLTRR